MLFFTLCVFSFAFGIFNIITIGFIRIDLPERGLRSLLMPMLPLATITFIQLFHYYLSPTGSGFIMQSWWRAGYETSRILIAMGWISVTYYHYALNGIETFKRGTVTGFAAGLSCLWILIMMDLFTHMDLHQETLGNIGIVSTLYFAGLRAVAILRHRKPLLDSTKLALSLAILSLVIYPGIALADAFGWNLPVFEKEVPIWIQVHPLYYVILNIPILIHLINLIKRRDRKKTLSGISLHEQDLSDLLVRQYGLTPREIDVTNLILNGYSNKQIAELLSLSLATVKTHIYRIFNKMNISSRTEMFVEIGQWTA